MVKSEMNQCEEIAWSKGGGEVSPRGLYWDRDPNY
jgi:hypothetical protein